MHWTEIGADDVVTTADDGHGAALYTARGEPVTLDAPLYAGPAEVPAGGFWAAAWLESHGAGLGPQRRDQVRRRYEALARREDRRITAAYFPRLHEAGMVYVGEVRWSRWVASWSQVTVVFHDPRHDLLHRSRPDVATTTTPVTLASLRPDDTEVVSHAALRAALESGLETAAHDGTDPARQVRVLRHLLERFAVPVRTGGAR